MTKIYQHWKEKIGEPSAETKHYARELENAVTAFAEHESLDIAALSVEGLEHEIKDVPATIFRVHLVVSELTPDQLDDLLKKELH